jgi:hypothetical protein
MNNLSKQPYRLIAAIVSVLMVFALFMPAISIMGKYEVSFWEVVKQLSDGAIGGQSGPDGRSITLIFAFLFMLFGPIITFITALANGKKALIMASSPFFAFLGFMIILNTAISSGFPHDNLSEIIQYKIGFYIYLLSAIALLITHIMWPKDGESESVDDTTFSTQEGTSVRPNSPISGITYFLQSDWMTEFMPLKFLDSYEAKQFGELCAGHPLAARVSRFSLLAGLIMIYFVNEFLNRLDIGLMPDDLFLATLAVAASIASFLLWPIMMRAVALKYKVFYCLFILLIAIVCAYLGFRFAILVLIYVITYWIIYAIRKYRKS